MKNKCQKNEKICTFCQKNAKNRVVKMLKPYYKTRGGSLTPRVDRAQKITNNFKELEKIVKTTIKLRVFSQRLFERSHGGGGGGVHWGLMGRGRGRGQKWGGGNSAVGAIMGFNSGGVFNLHTAFHVISISLQNS